MTTRVSLAELAAAGIQLRPAEAVALVRDICGQYTSGLLRGIPSPGIIRLTRDGAIVAEGPMTTGDAGVARAAHLLADLLPDFEAPAAYRAGGGLRLVLARALGTLDLPPYGTLDDFCAALRRFAEPDMATAARTLFRAWAQHRAMQAPRGEAAALTISDVRRARRATGLSLDDLSVVADVPAPRLRELEWGYLRNWRADDEGRAHVVRYARAAGLDEQIVLSIAWPMIEEASTIAGLGVEAIPVTAMVPSGPQALAMIQAPSSRGASSRAASWGLAVIGAALLAVASFAIATEAEPRRAATHAPVASTPAATRETPPTVGSAASPAAAPRTATPARQGKRPGRAPSAAPPLVTSHFSAGSCSESSSSKYRVNCPPYC